jgi:hypothetical protein
VPLADQPAQTLQRGMRRPPPAGTPGGDMPLASELAGQREEGDSLHEIHFAVRWLVPKGERFANFDILNDNDTQLDYFRRFGHI